MKVKAPEMARALAGPDPKYRCFFLYGPDEAASRTLAERLSNAMGADAERIDLDGPTLKDDPARLADEANAFSMFAAKRWIRVKAGDEALAAIEALLEGTPSDNPVVLIAGDLKKTSALVKRLDTDPTVLVCQSYLPDVLDAGRLAIQIGRELGLQIDPDVAKRIAEGSVADQSLMRREIEKFALYLDADPAHVKPLASDVLDRLGADSDEGDIGKLVNAVMDGRATAAAAELALLGEDSVRILNVLAARVLLLARLRAEVERGASVTSVMASGGRGIFFKEQPIVARQLQRWPPARLATAHARLAATRRAVMASSASAGVIVAAELIAIARMASSLR